jgi:hypothetical protein
VPKTVYSNGSRVYAAWVNAMQGLVFDDQDIDGHYARLTDGSLSNVAGNIKPQWTAFRDGLKASASAGLSVSYAAGTIQGVNGLPISIAAGAVTGLANNAVSFIYADQISGAILAGPISPSIWYPIARVTTSGGVVTLVEDIRDRSYRISPKANLVKVLGGTGGNGDYNLASGSATLGDGLYYFRNFTIANGATLTISAFARIFCSGNVVINGAVNVTTLFVGGSSLELSAALSTFPIPGAGVGSGLGVSTPYNPAISPVGSSGTSGGVTGVPGSGAVIFTGRGGAGGGGLWIEAGGTISLGSTGAISCDGGNAFASTYSFGSGFFQATGASGGSGGTVQLSSGQSIRLEAGSSISCNAGTSSAGIRGGGSASNSGGGGGSGGGQVILSSPIAPVTLGTITVAGAAAGASPVGTTLTNGGPGGASNGGQGGTVSNAAAPPIFMLAGAAGRIVSNAFLSVGA